MNNVKMYRGKYSMPQKKLADALGVTRAGLNLIENGKIWIINKKTVLKMCDIFNVSPSKLLGDENFKYLPETVEDIDYMISILNKLKEGK